MDRIKGRVIHCCLYSCDMLQGRSTTIPVMQPWIAHSKCTHARHCYSHVSRNCIFQMATLRIFIFTEQSENKRFQ